MGIRLKVIIVVLLLVLTVFLCTCISISEKTYDLSNEMSDIKKLNEKIVESNDNERDSLKVSNGNDNINYEYCDVSKYNEFKWIEIENIIDTNDMEYNDLDESNKVLYRLYNFLKKGALIKDKSFHKLFLLHADDVNDWNSIVTIDIFREMVNSEYYLDDVVIEEIH